MKGGAGKVAEGYTHPDQTLLMRPEVGTQAQFRKKKPPQTYRYDSSLSPALDWDGGNGARELGEWLLSVIERAAALQAPHVLPSPAELKTADGRVVLSVLSLQEAVDQLKRLGRPFLTWTGKAERLSFDVPTLPLFVHERLSTKAIVETLVGHKTDKQTDFWDMLGDPRHSITDQVLKAYEYPDKWVNRLILGDSLVVMNSLLHYERLGGQVQMIYIDPPYGVKFGSNFQPFVRKRDVSHGDDEDLIQSYGSFVERMIEILRRSPVQHVGGGKTVELGNIRPPAKSLSLSAEGVALNRVRLKPDTTDEAQPVAFVFGPENGAISEKLVHSALQEAQLKSYTNLYVIGFAIQPHARGLIDKSADMGLVPATYVQATPDLMMGDLLKHMRSSQIFSVCGLPEIKIHKAKPVSAGAPSRYEMELVGLDTFDPTTMATEHLRGDDVPCWMLDADYNGLCFRASQVFFPRTAAWDSLKKALKGDYEESVWDHLAGARSAPFESGDQKQVAVKVIDDRGNELLVVKPLP